MNRLNWIVTVFLIGYGVVVLAHHSRPAHFYLDKTVAVEGVVSDVFWRNPHVYVYLEVEGDDGELSVWELELQNTISMTRKGWAQDTVKVDDYILAKGNPHRSGRQLMLVTYINRPADGFDYHDKYAF